MHTNRQSNLRSFVFIAFVFCAVGVATYYILQLKNDASSKPKVKDALYWESLHDEVQDYSIPLTEDSLGVLLYELRKATNTKTDSTVRWRVASVSNSWSIFEVELPLNSSDPSRQVDLAFQSRECTFTNRFAADVRSLVQEWFESDRSVEVESIIDERLVLVLEGFPKDDYMLVKLSFVNKYW